MRLPLWTTGVSLTGSLWRSAERTPQSYLSWKLRDMRCYSPISVSHWSKATSRASNSPSFQCAFVHTRLSHSQGHRKCSGRALGTWSRKPSGQSTWEWWVLRVLDEALSASVPQAQPIPLMPYLSHICSFAQKGPHLTSSTLDLWKTEFWTEMRWFIEVWVGSSLGSIHRSLCDQMKLESPGADSE